MYSVVECIQNFLICMCNRQSRQTGSRILGNEAVFERARKLDTGDVHDTPEDIAQPNRDGEADEPSDEKSKTVLKVGLFASDVPDIRHEGVAQAVEYWAVNDIESKRDFAQILGQWIGEQFLNVWGVVDGEDDENGTNGLCKAMWFGVCVGGDMPQPSIERRPFEANVGARSKIETDHEKGDPKPAARNIQCYFAA